MLQEASRRLTRKVTTDAGSRITVSHPNRISPPDSGAMRPHLSPHSRLLRRVKSTPLSQWLPALVHIHFKSRRQLLEGSK
jgi:hypothetical protein